MDPHHHGALPGLAAPEPAHHDVDALASLNTGSAGATPTATTGAIASSTPGETRLAAPAFDPEAYTAEDFERDELRGALDAISEENDELKQRFAVECMDATEEDKLLAHDLITDLRRQVKQLTLELHATQSTRNSYMVENGELKKTVAYWRRRAEKAEKGAA